jgi:hypothetical protein
MADSGRILGPVPPGPAPAARLAAIVLVGGLAAGLGGADKPGLVVGGRTLLAATASAAAGAGAGHIMIVGPDRPGAGSGRPSRSGLVPGRVRPRGRRAADRQPR